MDSGFEFPFAFALEGDFFLAYDADFNMGFAFRVGFSTNSAVNILSSCCLDILSWLSAILNLASIFNSFIVKLSKLAISS